MTAERREVFCGALGTLEETIATVSTALAVVFELHDSLYMGGDYYLGHLEDGGVVRIRPNVDLIDDMPEISAWPGPVFVEVDASDPEAITRQLEDAGLTPLSLDR